VSADLRGYGPRPANLPLHRGAVDFTDEAGVAAMIALLGDAQLPPIEENAATPFVGITTDGLPKLNLFGAADEGAPTAAATAAAAAFLAGLGPESRKAAQLPMDSERWRLWGNAFRTFPEHGLLLQELPDEQRAAALAVIESSFSSEGFAQVREAMRLNAVLGDLIGGYADTLTEFCYWFTVFGEPSSSAPWGWQLQGHHVDLHCVLIGSQIVVTPTFIGVELGGDRVFGEHRLRAREVMESLSTPQRDRALLYGSMLAADLPPEVAGIIDGRHRAGAGRDNLVLPYTGLAADDLSPGQRELLLALIDPYLINLPDTPREHRRAQVEKHLGDTHFAWIGNWDQDAPFYYRVHSPVLLLEYDNHPGILLNNPEPEPFHVHTIVRTPNGGDYGMDLLRRHYAAHQH
jgi:Protein of unknown function (DUF3500)